MRDDPWEKEPGQDQQASRFKAVNWRPEALERLLLIPAITTLHRTHSQFSSHAEPSKDEKDIVDPPTAV